MKQLHWLAIAAICGATVVMAQTPQNTTRPDPPAPVEEHPDSNGWVVLFDGKTLSGWKSYEGSGWSVVDGAITGQGPTTHLFSPNTYTNLEFKAECRLNHSGNSGMYIRTRWGKSFPRGYEAQVENTSPDPQRTGSLYGFHPVREQLVADDTWWTQEVIAIGNRIIIKVNGKIVTDFVDKKNTYKRGYLALQQHNDGSIVNFRNLQVKRLPDDAAEALKIVQKDHPGVPDQAPEN